MNATTICAISTAKGVGGIAVIRVSGKEALNICNKIIQYKNGDTIFNQSSYTVKYASIFDKDDEIIDDVIVSVFLAPNSFTGEDVVEISSHGSQYIQQHILQTLIYFGCSLAKQGEFTMRAFENGKMDLSQAEAVADLIASSSVSTHRMAMNQMRGKFSTELKELRSNLLDFVSLVELELDFAEEDVEFADRSELKKLAKKINAKISKLIKSFVLGNAIKNGVPVVLVGETNVGKSTLLNLLLNEEKAIVSEIHGTTRDVIEDVINMDGIIFRFIDTAGIRQTTDVIENLGIKKTYQKIEYSEIILWIIDASQPIKTDKWIINEMINLSSNKKMIVVFNKIDQASDRQMRDIESEFYDIDLEKIYISAKTAQNIDKLKHSIVEASQIKTIQTCDVIISNTRHYEALIMANKAIERVIEGIDNNLSGDFLSQDIRETMLHIGEITGQISNSEMLENIFSKFCIGK